MARALLGGAALPYHTSKIKTRPQFGTSFICSAHCTQIMHIPIRRMMPAICAAHKNQEANPLLRLAVGAVTELLRIFNTEDSDFVSGSTTPSDVSVASVDDLMTVIECDYERSYFLTGEFTASIYAEDCCFADPTIKFNGRDLYKRNLQLLVPFLENPSLLLCGIKKGLKGNTRFIESKWQLRTYLKLPWKPLISIEGSTIYDLDDNLKIIRHVEGWNVSPIEAIGQMLVPSSNPITRK